MTVKVWIERCMRYTKRFSKDVDMTNVFFLMRYYTEDAKDNLALKHSYQIQAAKNIGLDVWFIECRNDGLYLKNEDREWKLKNMKIKKDGGLLQAILLYHLLNKAGNQAKKIAGSFDNVYIRKTFYIPSYFRFLKNVKKDKSKIVVEIPTYPDRSEERKETRIIRKIIFELNGLMAQKAASYVDLFAVIGEDVFNYLGKKAINIENGINVERLPLRKKEGEGNAVHCLALASMSKWQGYDRFIEGMRDYYERGGIEDIYFHMVGDDGDGSLVQWKKMVIEYGLEKRVLFHGAQYGEDLSKLFNQCDIGIGSLAGYRKNLYKASILKIREYTSRGLPFVYAIDDTALKGNENFCMKIKNDASPVEIEEVLCFANKVKGNTNMAQEMRIYAEKNMTWEKQFQKIIYNL